MRVLCLLLLVFTSTVPATEVEREQRWIEQTADVIFDGEPVYLDVPGHRFFAIYTESAEVSVNGAIVLHGTGFHPDYDQVVRPLRVGLTDVGWNTLSIQLPLLESLAKYEDYVSVYPEVPPRINAAIEYLRQQGSTNIVIVAHSQGATMACYYLANTKSDVKALVAIGMSAQHLEPHINSAETLKRIELPVLDIYGSRDFPVVLYTAEKRQQGAAHNPHYSQMIIDGATHFFDFYEEALVSSVSEWLAPIQQ